MAIAEHSRCTLYDTSGIPNLAKSDAMEPPGTYSRKMFRVSSVFSVPCTQQQHVSWCYQGLALSCALAQKTMKPVRLSQTAQQSPEALEALTRYLTMLGGRVKP